jgi:hypothetical protein
MAVEATTEGEVVVLESVDVWQLGDCWINTSTALQMLSH